MWLRWLDGDASKDKGAVQYQGKSVWQQIAAKLSMVLQHRAAEAVGSDLHQCACGTQCKHGTERQWLLTVPWERGGRRFFGGLGSKVFSATPFESMRTLLLPCLSHRAPPALAAFLPQHLHKAVGGLAWEATAASGKKWRSWICQESSRGQEHYAATPVPSYIIHKSHSQTFCFV